MRYEREEGSIGGVMRIVSATPRVLVMERSRQIRVWRAAHSLLFEEAWEMEPLMRFET